MFVIYKLLYTIGFLALTPRFIYDALRRGKYAKGFSQRLGSLESLPIDNPVIWLHCVSVGETQAARTLVTGLRKQFPNHKIVISTTTITGQRLAKEIFKTTAATVFYFPFDWKFSVNRTLARINPAAVLLMETEIWPGFIRSCHRRAIPVAIVNGRISERSFRRYRLIRPFISRVLALVDIAVMQSADDARRIEQLGMDPEKVFSSGNLKFDVETSGETPKALRQLLSSDDRPLLVAASTHAPEERIVIATFQRLIEANVNARLLIAPRHPERFAEVAALMQATGLSYVRKTQATAGTKADLILLDTIGELREVYPLAALVFVGGSIAKNGGHNILEPAAIGSCIIIGAHTFNFAAIVREFVEQDALIQLPPLAEPDAVIELADLFTKLLADPAQCNQLRNRSHTVVRENIGATQRTLQLIVPLISSSVQAPAQSEPSLATQVRSA